VSEMIERVAQIIRDFDTSDHMDCEAIARAVIEAMRELPEEPGPRYTAGEYSRRTQAAMVDDALER
jgi:hypothetical protein